MSRTLQFILFFSIVALLFSMFQYYVVHTFKRWAANVFSADHQQRWKKILRLVLIIGNALFVAQFAFRWYGWYHTAPAQILVIYPAAFYFASIITGVLFLLVKDGARLVLFLIHRTIALLKKLNNAGSTSFDPPVVAPPSNSRRQFLKLGGASFMTAIVGMPILSSLATARDYQINRVPLVFEHLPVGLDGLTIAHVSDLHSGPYMTELDMIEIFKLTNALNPQITVVTGDFVDSVDSEIPAVYNAITTLKAEYGIFGCLGNHDHFATAEKVNDALEQRNITMVNNRHQLLPINGEQVALIGIDDFGSGSRNFANFSKAAEGLHPDSFKILLSHRPDFFDRAKQAGMDLTLAGHTHGGQVGIEYGFINLNPVYLVHKYAKGLYEENGKKLYVNVGVGMVGAPIRLIKPEITLFTLKCA
jgi:predicted MPP superfamily phosphohydrolase